MGNHKIREQWWLEVYFRPRFPLLSIHKYQDPGKSKKYLQHDITLGWELEMFVNLSLNFYRDPFFPRQRKTPLWGAFKHVRTNVIDDQPHLFVVVVVGQWEHLSGDHHRDQWKICHVIPSESQENWKSLNDVWPRPLCMLSYSPSDALSLSLRSQLLHHPWERAITVISN